MKAIGAISREMIVGPRIYYLGLLLAKKIAVNLGVQYIGQWSAKVNNDDVSHL